MIKYSINFNKNKIMNFELKIKIKEIIVTKEKKVTYKIYFIYHLLYF